MNPLSNEERDFVTANLKLVHRAISRFRVDEDEKEDFIQSAIFGLMRAAKDFDSARGTFSTYAYAWVTCYAWRYMFSQRKLIRVPEYLETIAYKAKRITAAAAARGKDHLAAEEVAAGIPTYRGPGYQGKAKTATVKELRRAEVGAGIRIETTADHFGEAVDLVDTLSDGAATAEDVLAFRDDFEAALRGLDALDSKTRNMIKMKLGLDPYEGEKTLAEVGEVFGLSRERVRQITVAGFAKIARSLND